LTIYCQNIELMGSVNKNDFYNFNRNLGHFRSSYTSGFGYSVKIGIENIKIDWMKLRLTLNYDSYNGELKASDGGLAGDYTVEAKVKKSIISVGIFPINFKIRERLDINIGFELSRLINEEFQGTKSGWFMYSPNYNYDLKEIYDRFSALKYFGFSGRLAYDFKLSESISISPQYLYYFGLSNEFDEFPERTKSKRQYFCLGIEKKIK
jgi:hypothetical protein